MTISMKPQVDEPTFGGDSIQTAKCVGNRLTVDIYPLDF